MKFTHGVVVVSLVSVFALIAMADNRIENETQAERDKLKVAVQAICPVSGQKLGSHGKPVKIRVGKAKEEVFLCCKACAKGKLNVKHWATIHANAVKAQGVCPIMKKELPKKAKWTVVKGQVVYVCCPPCTDKIQAEPEKHLKTLDALYTQALKRTSQQR